MGPCVDTSCTRLTSLRGLGALERVGGYAHIYAMKHLRSLEGLGSLARVGTHLVVSELPALRGLDGLSSLVWGTIRLSNREMRGPWRCRRAHGQRASPAFALCSHVAAV